PTGNFGNILAAYFAKQMGVPIDQLVCASNENKVLFDFFRTGTYDRNREFLLTSSPSMDILISSNLERLIYLVSGRNAAKNAELMKMLKTEGQYTVTLDMKVALADFEVGYATQEETAQAIRDLYEKTGYVIDTHTAVAAKVGKEYQKESGNTKKCVVVSTASPYKFGKSVMTAIDEAYATMDDFALLEELEKISQVSMPVAIQEIRNAKILHTQECEVDQMEETVKEILHLEK
ncbi:MAG: threonine synthase, partial [Lachnospiraceae bacterium]